MGISINNFEVGAGHRVEECRTDLANTAADLIESLAAGNGCSWLVAFLRRTLSGSLIEGEGFAGSSVVWLIASAARRMLVLRLALLVVSVVKVEMRPKEFISSALVTWANMICGSTTTVS